jgi:hypothetical protein
MDNGKEARFIFCDISKAFDKVWHKGLLYKLERAGIKGKILNWIESYLTNRKQQVVINGQISTETTISAGVPQGSVLGPLLFILYINDITEDIDTEIRLYADDTCIYIDYTDSDQAAADLESNLEHITRWAKTWFVTFNAKKTVDLVFTRKRNNYNFPITMSGIQIDNTTVNHKHLGLTFQKDGKWHKHISEIITKAKRRNDILRSNMYALDRKSLETMYLSYVRPTLEYASEIWDSCTIEEKTKLEDVQLEAARIALGAKKGTSHEQLYNAIKWETLQDRRDKLKLATMYKVLNNMTGPTLRQLIPATTQSRTPYNLRTDENITQIRTRTDALKNSFIPSTINAWNRLPAPIRNAESIDIFKSSLRKHFGTKEKVKQRFYEGNRKAQILHNRIRLGNSDLRQNLALRNLADNPMCECGDESESEEHYLMECTNYSRQRTKMMTKIRSVTIEPITSSILLQGSVNLEEEKNIKLIKLCQKYILETKRFK